MNAKTLEAIRKHGEALLAAFPNATERDPIALCKKLRRIETAVSKPILFACNGNLDEGRLDTACQAAKTRTLKLLGEHLKYNSIIAHCGFLFVNRDPRGCALKLDEQWTRAFNNNQYTQRKPSITMDMGGYGLLAPDLTTK